MNVLDVNVLIALYGPTHEFHPRARVWWEETLTAGDQFTVPDLVWVSFLRLMTNPRVVSVPATYAQAWEFVTAMKRQGGYVEHVVDARVLPECTRIAVESHATGNLVTDAYIAASATTLGAAVVTFDRDFRRFDGVRTIEPA